MTLLAWLEQHDDEDFLRTPMEWMLEQLLEFEVSNRIQAGQREQGPERQG